MKTPFLQRRKITIHDKINENFMILKYVMCVCVCISNYEIYIIC
jgi:hypothetical protein